MNKSWASSMTRHSTPDFMSNSNNRYLRSLQCPRAPRPSAVNRKFPRAASLGSFFGAVTASTGYRRPPIIPASRLAALLTSRIPIVLPHPRSPHITFPRLSFHAVTPEPLQPLLAGGFHEG